jgi:hypothetical protein
MAVLFLLKFTFHYFCFWNNGVAAVELETKLFIEVSVRYSQEI